VVGLAGVVKVAVAVAAAERAAAREAAALVSNAPRTKSRGIQCLAS